MILSLCLVLIFLSCFLLYIASRQLQDLGQARLIEVGDLLSANVATGAMDPLFNEMYVSLGENLMVASRQPDVSSLTLVNRDHIVVASTDDSLPGTVFDPGCREGTTFHDHEIHFCRAISLYGQDLGHVYLVLSTARIDQELRTLFLRWGVSMAVLFFVIIAGALVYISRLTAPLRQILGVTRAVARGEFIAPRLSRGFYELDQIARAMTVMTEAIGERERHNQKITMEKTELSEYLTSIMNAVPWGLAALDKEGRLVNWNLGFENLLEPVPPEIKGQTLESLLKPPFPAGQLHHSVILGEKIKDLSVVCSRECGDPRFFHVSLFPLRFRESSGAVLVIEDVTKRKRIDAALAEADKMFTLGGMAAGMAHEINNPLSGMMQAAQLIESRLRLESKKVQEAREALGLEEADLLRFFEEQQIYPLLAAVTDSGKRISGIIRNMLSYSRKSDGSFEPSGLEELLEQSLELAVNDTYGSEGLWFRRISLVREYSDVPVRGVWDKGKILQVLLNILKNGAQAMKGHSSNRDGGYQPRFILRTYTLESRGFIEIEDNGPGIPDSIRDRIFDPFFTTKQAGEGTGLGMSISYAIVREDHRGDLRVESDGVSWTRFILELPLLPGEADEALSGGAPD